MHDRTSIAVYLSGSIKKGKADTRASFWSDDDIAAITKTASPHEVFFLNPSSRSDDLSDFLGTFGRDLLQVFCSDAVMVDARDRRGIGIGSEMTFAKLHRIPVISIAPLGTEYNRREFEFLGQKLTSWVHPFVYGLSDAVVETVEDGTRWLIDYMVKRQPEAASIIGPERFDSAMRHYVATQLERDVEMARLIHSSPQLEERVSRLRD